MRMLSPCPPSLEARPVVYEDGSLHLLSEQQGGSALGLIGTVGSDADGQPTLRPCRDVNIWVCAEHVPGGVQLNAGSIFRLGGVLGIGSSPILALSALPEELLLRPAAAKGSSGSATAEGEEVRVQQDMQISWNQPVQPSHLFAQTAMQAQLLRKGEGWYIECPRGPGFPVTPPRAALDTSLWVRLPAEESFQLPDIKEVAFFAEDASGDALRPAAGFLYSNAQPEGLESRWLPLASSDQPGSTTGPFWVEGSTEQQLDDEVMGWPATPRSLPPATPRSPFSAGEPQRGWPEDLPPPLPLPATGEAQPQEQPEQTPPQAVPAVNTPSAEVVTTTIRRVSDLESLQAACNRLRLEGEPTDRYTRLVGLDIGEAPPATMQLCFQGQDPLQNFVLHFANASVPGGDSGLPGLPECVQELLADPSVTKVVFEGPAKANAAKKLWGTELDSGITDMRVQGTKGGLQDRLRQAGLAVGKRLKCTFFDQWGIRCAMKWNHRHLDAWNILRLYQANEATLQQAASRAAQQVVQVQGHRPPPGLPPPAGLEPQIPASQDGQAEESAPSSSSSTTATDAASVPAAQPATTGDLPARRPPVFGPTGPRLPPAGGSRHMRLDAPPEPPRRLEAPPVLLSLPQQKERSRTEATSGAAQGGGQKAAQAQAKAKLQKQPQAQGCPCPGKKIPKLLQHLKPVKIKPEDVCVKTWLSGSNMHQASVSFPGLDSTHMLAGKEFQGSPKQRKHAATTSAEEAALLELEKALARPDSGFVVKAKQSRILSAVR